MNAFTPIQPDPIPQGTRARQWQRSVDDASEPFFCYGCDTERSFARCYCPSCDEQTDGYQRRAEDRFTELLRRADDEICRAKDDLQRERELNAAIAHIGQRIERLGAFMGRGL